MWSKLLPTICQTSSKFHLTYHLHNRYQTPFFSNVNPSNSLTRFQKKERKRKKIQRRKIKKLVPHPRIFGFGNPYRAIFALSSCGNACAQSNRLLDELRETREGERQREKVGFPETYSMHTCMFNTCEPRSRPGQDVKLRHLNNFI